MADKIDYSPRNTTLDKDGNIRVRGKVVCKPNPHNHVRKGSFYTPKGTPPRTKEDVVEPTILDQIESGEIEEGLALS